MPVSKAFVERSNWRVIEVGGQDAVRWLNDLVTAEIEMSDPRLARRSLFLTPTGAVRAEFTVVSLGDHLLLIQDSRQAESIGDLLDPYVLSSDVRLRDRSDGLALFSLPDRTEPVDLRESDAWWSPSALGGPGVDVIIPIERRESLRAELAAAGLRELGPDEIERWRIEHGIARLDVDASAGDLPLECGLADAVAFDKGCFVGQEAVAKTRNRGHPRRLLLRLESDADVPAGESVIAADGSEAGRVTSAAPRSGRGTVLLSSVRWAARDGALHARSGARLVVRSAQDAVA